MVQHHHFLSLPDESDPVSETAGGLVDGDLDLAFSIDAKLRVFTNERLGQYRERTVPQTVGVINALESADLNSDGVVDIVVLNREGQIFRLSDQGGGKDWQVAEVVRVGEFIEVYAHAPAVPLRLADPSPDGVARGHGETRIAVPAASARRACGFDDVC